PRVVRSTRARRTRAGESRRGASGRTIVPRTRSAGVDEESSLWVNLVPTFAVDAARGAARARTLGRLSGSGPMRKEYPKKAKAGAATTCDAMCRLENRGARYWGYDGRGMFVIVESPIQTTRGTAGGALRFVATRKRLR